MRSLCKWLIVLTMVLTMLQFVGGSTAEAHRRRAYVRHRSIPRAYHIVAPRYRAAPRVRVAAPGVRVYVGPGVRVYAPYVGVYAPRGHGRYYGW